MKRELPQDFLYSFVEFHLTMDIYDELDRIHKHQSYKESKPELQNVVDYMYNPTEEDKYLIDMFAQDTTDTILGGNLSGLRNYYDKIVRTIEDKLTELEQTLHLTPPETSDDMEL